jgi:hypothetical protein
MARLLIPTAIPTTTHRPMAMIVTVKVQGAFISAFDHFCLGFREWENYETRTASTTVQTCV